MNQIRTSLSDEFHPEESALDRKPGSLWIRKDLATFCGVSEECVRKWERLGEGPPRAPIPGRLVRYREQDVKSWLDERAQARPRNGRHPQTRAR